MSPLGFLSLACVLSAIGLLVSWATRRHDSLGRPRDLPVWSVSALVVLALAAAYPGAQRKIDERRLGYVATVVTGTEVRVHCQSTIAALVDTGAELGWVAFDENGVPELATRIKREQCALLKAYRAGHRTLDHDTVLAVHVLTHEAMHMRGERSEAVAECQAVQRDRLTARALGATEAEAAALATLYWRTVYPRMPDGYWSDQCKPGGELDENLASAPW
jgi:hypothetical protein